MWIKLNVDMFDNRKIKYIRTLPEGNNICLIWIMLLTMAGKCNAGGMIHLTETIPYTADMLAAEFDYDVSVIHLAFEVLNSLGMISLNDSQKLEITNWDKYQNVEGMDKIREQTRARVAKHREQKKLCNVSSNATVTLSNATDKDKEEDKDIDKEINTLAESDKKIEHPQVFADVSPIVLSDGTDFVADQDFVDKMQNAYPSVDIKSEFRKMAAWCISNESNRKTKRGIKKFINGWLDRSQNQASRNNKTSGRYNHITHSYIEANDSIPLTEKEMNELHELMERMNNDQ